MTANRIAEEYDKTGLNEVPFTFNGEGLYLALFLYFISHILYIILPELRCD